MNAAEARKLAECVDKDSAEQKRQAQEIKEVGQLITEAVNKGLFECEYSHKLSSSSAQYFIKLGFTIEWRQVGYNEYSYKIIW